MSVTHGSNMQPPAAYVNRQSRRGNHRATRQKAAGKPSNGGGLIAGALAVAMVSAGVGGAVALAVHPSPSGSASMVPAAAAAPQPPASVPAAAVEQIAAKVVPSVVKLETDVGSQSEQGSGIILSSDGTILTNNHVVSGASGGPGAQSAANTVVTLADGRSVPFSVIGTDPTCDIAVVRAQGVSGLTPIALGSSSNLRVGQHVMAVGSPLGLDDTVTTGIVSALNRPVSAAGNAGNPNTVLDAIQTDAPLNPGNSGGPLVDMNGALIGMNSAMASLGGGSTDASGSIGLGFAIPVDQAKRIADELIGSGKASHASLGAQVSNAAPTRGAKIVTVATGGPAQAAGLSDGEVITKVDDQVIGGPDALAAAVGSKAPLDNVTLTYVEPTGAAQTTQVTLGTDQAQQ
jgi:putative serine protease PepD